MATKNPADVTGRKRDELAAQNVEEIQKRIDEINKPYEEAKKRVEMIDNDITEYNKNIESHKATHAAAIVSTSHENVGFAAEAHALHHGADEHIAKMARDTAKKGLSFKEFREKRAQEKRADKAIEEEAGIKPDTGLPPKA